MTDKNLTASEFIDDGGLLQANVNNPAVHPGGEFFVFEYNSQIWRMNIDGSGAEQLLIDDKRLRYPAWSPDGKYLVFTVWDTNFTSALKSLFFYNLENKAFHRIDIDNLLTALGEPWGPLSWTQK